MARAKSIRLRGAFTPTTTTMYPRTEYEMTEADLAELLDACKPVPAMLIGGYAASPQENANRAWRRLGEKMGFDFETVRPTPGKGMRFFTAVPSETPEHREARLEREAAERKAAEIALLQKEIEERQVRLGVLQGN